MNTKEYQMILAKIIQALSFLKFTNCSAKYMRDKRCNVLLNSPMPNLRTKLTSDSDILKTAPILRYVFGVRVRSIFNNLYVAQYYVMIVSQFAS
jgi:hypothetical protein